MIKRIIGILAVLASVVAIVSASMHADRFSSFVFNRAESVPAVETVETALPAAIVSDSVGMTVPADTMQMQEVGM